MTTLPSEVKAALREHIARIEVTQQFAGQPFPTTSRFNDEECDAIFSALRPEIEKFIAETEKRTAQIYEKELRRLTAFRDAMVLKDALRVPEKMYICDNPVCSKLHTASEIEALTHPKQQEKKQ